MIFIGAVLVLPYLAYSIAFKSGFSRERELTGVCVCAHARVHVCTSACVLYLYIYIYFNIYLFNHVPMYVIYLCISLSHITIEHLYIEREILRNQLTKLWECTSLKSTGQDSRVETQVRLATGLRQNAFFFKKSCSLLLRPLNDWMRPAHPTRDNLLYLLSADCRCQVYLQNIYAATPGSVLD